MSLRNRMKEFYRMVHPDLGHGFPSEAVSKNTASLMELNSYVDRLTSTTGKDSPFVARNIQFFTPVMRKDGSTVPSSTRPFWVELKSIPPDADLIERSELSEILLEQLKEATAYIPMIPYQNREHRQIDNILSSSSRSKSQSVRAKLTKLWYEEHERNQIDKSIYETDSTAADEISLGEYRTMLAHNKLVKNFSRIRNPSKRKEKLQSIESRVAEDLTDVAVCNDRMDTEANVQKTRLIQSGFHPDLVFFRPHLAPDNRIFGVRNVCGEFLSSDQDVWLLENIWDAMRTGRKPSVPLVLSDTWRASLDGGYIEVPFDFKLADLVDFLEDHLESVRQARKNLLDSFIPV